MWFVLQRPDKANDVHVVSHGDTKKAAWTKLFDDIYDRDAWGTSNVHVSPVTLFFVDNHEEMVKTVTPGCHVCEEYIRSLTP